MAQERIQTQRIREHITALASDIGERNLYRYDQLETVVASFVRSACVQRASAQVLLKELRRKGASALDRGSRLAHSEETNTPRPQIGRMIPLPATPHPVPSVFHKIYRAYHAFCHGACHTRADRHPALNRSPIVDNPVARARYSLFPARTYPHILRSAHRPLLPGLPLRR